MVGRRNQREDKGKDGGEGEPTYSLAKGFPCLLGREAHVRQHADLLGSWFGGATTAAAARGLDDRNIDIYSSRSHQYESRCCEEEGESLPGSSMCAKSHSIAASGSLLPVASNAFWHRTSGKPISSSWESAAWLNSGKAGSAGEW